MGKEEELYKSVEEILKLYNIELEPDSLTPNDDEVVDYAEAISKTREKLDELNEQAQEIYDEMGMSPEELDAYGSNPDNFTKEQWDALQKVKQECEGFKQRALSSVDGTAHETKAEPPKKKKKRKLVKRKDWMQL